MKSDFTVFFFSFFTLTAAAALEDLLPRFCGVVPPLVMASSIIFSSRKFFSWSVTLLFAAAAGAIEDSLCAFPPATSASFFVLASFVVRRLRLSMTLATLAFPLYIVWLWMWALVPSSVGLIGFFVFSILGFVTNFALEKIIGFAAKKAGVT
ncbi:MAG: hypothetical protein J6S51_02585 [Kiritimatiellae bacterium]|nr:hypothetical protein [Kiritimatiellia bacterium]